MPRILVSCYLYSSEIEDTNDYNKEICLVLYHGSASLGKECPGIKVMTRSLMGRRVYTSATTFSTPLVSSESLDSHD